MSAQILKHLCTCEGKGWVFENDERDLCMAGCLPPTKPPTDFTPSPAQDNRVGVLAQIKDWQQTVKAA